MDGKTAGVAAQIQNPGSGAIGPDAPPIFLLVQEMAGFLPMAKIGQHLGIVLPEGHQPRHLAVEAAGDLRQAFFFPDRYVISLVNSLGGEETGQELCEDVLPGLHTQAHDLQGKVIPKFIHSQTRQTVGISKYHPAGIVKPKGLPAGPGACQAAAKELPVDGFIGVPGEDPYQDFGLAVEEASGHKGAGSVDDVNHATVGAILVHPSGLVVVNPAFSPAELPLLPPA